MRLDFLRGGVDLDYMFISRHEEIAMNKKRQRELLTALGILVGIAVILSVIGIFT